MELDALRDSPLVTPWEDPVTGVVSHLLARDAAPLQQTFYFTNPGFTHDGRFLWFYCAFPPGGNANQGRSLGVADFALGTVRHFPETLFLDASPLVDPDSGEAYWCTGGEIWKRGPLPGDACTLVNRLPRELLKNRSPWRLATHLTFSADRTRLNIDATVGRETFIGHAPLDGGPVEIWQTMHAGFNHGQFSPTDPDLQLIAQDSPVDIVSGELHHYDNRMWLIRRGETARPIFEADAGSGESVTASNVHQNQDSRVVRDGPGMHGHEWWSADGRKVWFVHYGCGIKRVELVGHREEMIWPLVRASHAHTNAAETLVVADAQPPDDPAYSKVIFFNRKTQQQIDIVSHLPGVDAKARSYHIHPHPQFCLRDQVICYTTTVRGAVDVAFTAVEALVERTK